MIQLPTKIKVGKKKYKVDVERSLASMGLRGKIDYGKKRIAIGEYGWGYKYTPREMYATFWHELTHAILEDMGSKLEKDEKFVDAFSTRLTDAILSAKF